MRSIFHNKAIQEEFLKTGFHCMPLLGDAELERLRNRFLALKPDDGFSPKLSDAVQREYHCTFLDTNKAYKQEVYELILEFFGPPLSKILKGYKILNGNFYVKPPGTGEFEVHLNWTHFPHPSLTTVTCWCPIFDTDKENGTLELVPGSHRIVPDVSCISHPDYFHPFEAALKEKYLEAIPVKAGNCIIFDDTMIHYTSQNDSDSPRISIQIELLPEEVEPILYWLDPDHPEKGYEVYEIDRSYFIEENVSSMKNRPTFAKFIGHKENQNKHYSEADFLEAMKQGPATRKKMLGY